MLYDYGGDKMKCPKCYGNNTHVINSRLKFGGRYRVRQRRCADCDKSFHTYEITEDEFKKLKDYQRRELLND